MIWYAAHLLFYVKLKHKRHQRYSVWENIVLISAKTEDEAFAKAEKRGWNDSCMAPDDSFTWCGEPAEWVFAGVRKLTLCQEEKHRPDDGTEVSYLELEVPSKAALDKLIAGEPVTVRIEDGFADEDVAEELAASVGSPRRRLAK